MEGILQKYIKTDLEIFLFNFFSQMFQWFGLPWGADSPSCLTNPQELCKSESLS